MQSRHIERHLSPTRATVTAVQLRDLRCGIAIEILLEPGGPTPLHFSDVRETEIEQLHSGRSVALEIARDGEQLPVTLQLADGGIEGGEHNG